MSVSHVGFGTWGHGDGEAPAVERTERLLYFVKTHTESKMPDHPMAQAASGRAASQPVACVHCGKPIIIGKWDRWNGFLVRCPHCKALHGKRWSIRGVALASLVFNILSFLFTMRPARAITVIAVWAAVMFLVVPRVDSAPDAVQGTVIGFLVLGPVLVNMAILVKHRIQLDQQPGAVRVA